MFCVVELQDSHEQHFPPAEDDGDPTHEQRLSGHAAASCAGVSAGSGQGWVSFVLFFLQLRQIRAGTFNVYILIKYLQKFKGLSNTNTGETNAHTLVQ